MQKSKISLSFALIVALSLSLSAAISSSSASLNSYNNVQINIQTSSIQSGYFTVSAFNMTGFQESSVQTYYPAASFELPSGQYIFTVTANNQTNQIYAEPLASGASSNGATSISEPALPVPVVPSVEYGYSVQQISSSVSITITTGSVSSFPTNTLTVQVLYPNGTAAADASISASTVGSDYYWGYEPNVVTWTTTDSNGYATLVTPVAPEQIDAWIWLPLNATGTLAPNIPVPVPPLNSTGPMIPVLANVGLSGSTVIIPPQTTATITMQVQPQNYWVTPIPAIATPQAKSAGASSSTSSAGPGSIPASVYADQQGNPALEGTQAATLTPAPTAIVVAAHNNSILVLAALIAVVIAAITVTGVIVATRTKRKKQQTGTENSA